MGKDITYLGMDVHKKDIVVAMLVPGRKDPEVWRLANETQAVRRLARKIQRTAPGEVVCAYEAGACG